MNQDALKKYEDWKFKMSAYNMALGIISVDSMTVAPIDGASYRDKRTAFLSGELFSIQTDEKMLPILEEIQKDESVEEYLRKEASLYQEEMMKMNSIPKDEYVEFCNLRDTSYQAWHHAKQTNNYSEFEPYLKKMIAYQKKVYGYRKSDKCIYDQMLNDFEPGMDQEKYDSFFQQVKERIVPLIKQVGEAKQIETGFLHKEFSIEKQKQFMNEYLLKYLSFDPSWGYQNETEHPFTDWVCENDVRVTTKYLKNDLVSAIFSTVHETGHGWYEHNIDPRFDGTILSDGVSSGMHESQSRFCENYLGRSYAFWEANYDHLKSIFSEELKDVTLDEFYRAVNASMPSFIRTEADELTYPIHILIRYEIEKGLFNGSISSENLDQTWNEMYEKYLGITPKNASEGILQDVHWSGGSFGYFPTYALGSAIAAQFFAQMKQDMNVDEALANNRYIDCMNWLKENVQQYGCLYDANTILKKVTGKEFDPNFYLDYLEEKYTRLYNLNH